LVLVEGFEIRPFKSSDIDQVVQINLACLPEHYDQSFFFELYYRFPKTFLVATVHDEAVGYIMCRMEHGFSEMRRFNLIKKGHIVSIAVLSEYRRNGLGKALVAKALEGMEEYSVGECYLEVRVSNKPAINLYKKFGFTVVRRIGSYYKDGEDAFVMARGTPS